MSTTLSYRQFVPSWSSGYNNGILYPDGTYQVRNTPAWWEKVTVAGTSTKDLNDGTNVAFFPPNLRKITINLARISTAGYGAAGSSIFKFKVGYGNAGSTINDYAYTVAQGTTVQTSGSGATGVDNTAICLIPSTSTTSSDANRRWSGTINLSKIDDSTSSSKWIVDWSLATADNSPSSTQSARVAHGVGQFIIPGTNHLSMVRLFISSGTFTGTVDVYGANELNLFSASVA